MSLSEESHSRGDFNFKIKVNKKMRNLTFNITNQCTLLINRFGIEPV